MGFCTKCGEPLEDDALFCLNCGVNVKRRVSEADTPAQKMKAVPVSETAPEQSQDSGANQSDVQIVGGAQTYPGMHAEMQFQTDPGTAASGNASKFRVLLAGVCLGCAIVTYLILWACFGGSGTDRTQKADAASETESATGEAAALCDLTIEFVSADLSGFPEVRAYYRITDPATKETVWDIPAKLFTLDENLGDIYQHRDITSVSMLDDTGGLAISMVADKSSSISDADMDMIKLAMTEFIDSLQYDVGDCAEIISFDTIVREMCAFTDDKTLLSNGISNMFPEGDTAFYDALMSGIRHAAGQPETGCVIAFADGEDNASEATVDEVIACAKENMIPVYIVGIGSNVEQETLEYITGSTGGVYWYIDSLDDLGGIYDAVYKREKELYMICYQTDADSDKMQERNLSLSVSGQTDTGDGTQTTFDGNAVCAFRPTEVTEPEETKHESRYSLIKADVSWEKANRLCEEMGGHLVTITDEQEEETVRKLVEKAGLKGVWLGGYTSYDKQGQVFGHWITGEEFAYAPWALGEPSRYDKTDKVEEYYLMLWNVESLGGWTWNDQRNDPVADGFLAGKIGYVCEWED